MSNQLIGETEIKLDGKTYKLKPDFKALLLIEQLTRSSIIEIFNRFSDSKSTYNDVASIYYACMISGDVTLSDKITHLSIGEAIMHEGLIRHVHPAFKAISHSLTGQPTGNKKKE